MTTTLSPEDFATLDVVVMTSRPGCVRAVLDVELPRPRTLHAREHPRFVEYVGRIRDLIVTKS